MGRLGHHPLAYRPAARAVPWLFAVCLAACKSGSSDDDNAQIGGVCYRTTLQNCGSGPWDPFGMALTIAWVSGQCTEEVECRAQPVQSDLVNGIVTNDYINTNWLVSRVQDREPNDGTDSAVPVVLQARNSIFFTGSVNDADDPADVVALAVQSSDGLIAAYLCASPQNCAGSFLQSDQIYLDLLDQNGTLIQTTNPAQGATSHDIAWLPTPGLGYFVAVRARDTGGADFAYHLNIVD